MTHERSPFRRGLRAAPTAALAAALLFTAATASAAAAPDRASPFTAVRWEDDAPVVRFEGAWYSLESLDGLPTERILDHARAEYGDRWKKRFSEDLVDVLRSMGHEPGEEVRLGLYADGASVVRAGRMTEDNRDLVRDFNRGDDGAARERRHERSTARRSDGDARRSVAAQLADHMDRVWDEKPAAGRANVRILLTRGGEPYAGRVAIETEFAFRAIGERGMQVSQGANPNANGRFVYEGLEPGVWNLVVQGTAAGRFPSFTWSRDGVEVGPGDTPLFEIDLGATR